MLFFGVCFFLYFIKLSAGNGFFKTFLTIQNLSFRRIMIYFWGINDRGLLDRIPGYKVPFFNEKPSKNSKQTSILDFSEFSGVFCVGCLKKKSNRFKSQNLAKQIYVFLKKTLSINRHCKTKCVTVMVLLSVSGCFSYRFCSLVQNYGMLLCNWSTSNVITLQM